MAYEPPPPTTKQNDSYLPDSDIGKRNWMENFIAQIEKSENRFDIPEDEFERCRLATKAFIEAVDALKIRTDRTTSRIKHKNETRKKAVRECRALAMRLKHDPSRKAGTLTGLGLHNDDKVLTRLNAPDCCPHLMVRGTEQGGHVIRFEQRNAPSKVSAKPKGVSHLLLFAAVGDRALPVSEARLIAAVTKQPYKVNFPVDRGLEGRTITYYGRWMDRKGQMGPWSEGVSMILSRANAKMDSIEFAHLFANGNVMGNDVKQAA